MGCLNDAIYSNDNYGCQPPIRANVVYIPNNAYFQNINDADDNIYETDDFNLEDYPHFRFNFYFKDIRNINKVLSEKVYENGEYKIKMHKIFIGLNCTMNKSKTIEIEVIKGTNYKKHLRTEILDGCSLEIVKGLLEKYNSEFNIDSSSWYLKEHTTDIYVKSDKVSEMNTKTLQVFYDKDISRFSFKEIEVDSCGTIICDGIFYGMKPEGIVNKYNELKAEYSLDDRPEIFHYPKKSEPKKKVESNNNYQYNNRNNDSYSYSSDHNKSDNNDNNNDNNNNDNNNDNNDNNNNNNDNNSVEEEKRSVVLYNGRGERIGEVNRDGRIYRDGNFVGEYENNGVIRRNGSRVGEIDGSYIRGSDGQRKIEIDGSVIRNANGEKIGEIDSNGIVRDENGSKIGEAQGMDRAQAADFYFNN